MVEGTGPKNALPPPGDEEAFLAERLKEAISLQGLVGETSADAISRQLQRRFQYRVRCQRNERGACRRDNIIRTAAAESRLCDKRMMSAAWDGKGGVALTARHLTY